MNSQHLTPAIGITGLLGTLTLDGINTSVAILVGLTTLCYLSIKIYKELKDGESK